MYRDADAVSFAMNAMVQTGENKQHAIEEAIDKLRAVMERSAREIADLILTQSAQALLGFMWGNLLIESNDTSGDEKHQGAPLQKYQFALEYLHAVWSTHSPIIEGAKDLERDVALNILTELENLYHVTMAYSMVSSSGKGVRSDIEFHAKSSWVMIRGHRYQVLEKEFFDFVLAPHSEELYATYGINSQDLAFGLQEIATAMRSGYAFAADQMTSGMQRVRSLMEEQGVSQTEAIQDISLKDPVFAEQMDQLYRDVFFVDFAIYQGRPKYRKSF